VEKGMPYLRVARSRRNPGTSDQFGVNLLAAFKRQPGLQSFASGVDRASGQQIVISIWDTEEHARFSREALGSDVMREVQALGGQLDPPEFFEVTGQA
jgi:hypothetical protein